MKFHVACDIAFPMAVVANTRDYNTTKGNKDLLERKNEPSVLRNPCLYLSITNLFNMKEHSKFDKMLATQTKP